jgi:hypothetical protein
VVSFANMGSSLVYYRPIIIILMITSVVFSMGKFQNSEGQDVQEIKFSKYTSPADGIKINYPSDWLKKDTGLPGVGLYC